MKATKVLDRRVYRTGQIIFREGEQAWAAFLIERGSVDIIKNAESADPKCLATIKAGDVFGEMGLIDGSPRSATACAAEPTVLQVINEREFHRLLTAAEPGLLAIMKVILRRLRATNDALVGQSNDDYPMLETAPAAVTIPGHGDRSAMLANAPVSAFRPA